MKVLGIIPARFKSSRFPGKALVDVGGKTMVQRVYEQAEKARGLTRVLVATDDQRIYNHIVKIGGTVCMTDQQHPSGTDRCREAATLANEKFDFIVNIQGDEPFIDPRQIDELTNGLTHEVQIATQAKVIENPQKLMDPNCVKVLIDQSENAIYFSRSPLPYQKNKPIEQWTISFKYHQHIGIYAYRSDILNEITTIPQSALELAEGLEQLRWLENGYKIKVLKTNYQAYGIDTPEDLEHALAQENS